MPAGECPTRFRTQPDTPRPRQVALPRATTRGRALARCAGITGGANVWTSANCRAAEASRSRTGRRKQIPLIGCMVAPLWDTAMPGLRRPSYGPPS